MRRGDAEYQARRRKDAVVRTQHGRPQPADASAAVLFYLGSMHFPWCALRSWSSVKPESRYGAPQPHHLQEPDTDHNHNHDIQNRFDTGGHRDIPVDQVQPHSDYDQQHYNI
jgi:hypothetical protein